MALFATVAQLANQLAATSSRLAKRAAIAQAIAEIYRAAPGSADAALFVLYLSGQPFAEADPRKLNAGGALLSKAILAVSGTTDPQLTAAYRRYGDLGDAAYDLLEPTATTEPTLTLEALAATFAQMAAARTTASRAALAESLLRRATALEARYLVKLMLGDMRIGVKQSLVEEAIAVASGTSVAEVRNAVMLEADLGLAAQRAFSGTLAEARMTLFHPLGFMLASPADSAAEAIARFTPKHPGAADTASEAGVPPKPHPYAFLEDKYDGIRAQIHGGDPDQPGRIAIYSRTRDDITASFPELAEAFACLETPLILDGEILAWDFARNTALPFAALGQRIGRKRVSNDLRRQIPVVFMAFDLLFAGQQLLLDQPLEARRELLESIASQFAPRVQSPLAVLESKPQASLFDTVNPPEPSFPRLLVAPSRLAETAEDIDRAYAESRARANEGVMIKAAASPYQPGRRGIWWIKLKRELATLDVVVTGAEYGHGKRASLLSDYTFAVRAQDGQLLNVGKAYSGITDAEIAELTEFLQAHTLEDHGHFRTVEPLVILEVAFNNIMRSDRHASGFALRFPRIVRIRTDKPIEDIDTVARVEDIYQSQVDKPAETEVWRIPGTAATLR